MQPTYRTLPLDAPPDRTPHTSGRVGARGAAEVTLLLLLLVSFGAING